MLSGFERCLRKPPSSVVTYWADGRHRHPESFRSKLEPRLCLKPQDFFEKPHPQAVQLLHPGPQADHEERNGKPPDWPSIGTQTLPTKSLTRSCCVSGFTHPGGHTGACCHQGPKF